MSNRVHVGSMDMEDGSGRKTRKVVELGKKIKNIPKRLWEVGRQDPRRAIHALKVGVSLTIVSLLYLMEPLFKGIGTNAMWAVMTVVVVLEFSAGATLCKGFNRGLGTLIAGSLAFFIEFVANDSGKIFRAIFIGTAVFFIGTLATYLRFIPYIKKNYDYGVLIFLLTFNLITVSSYRVDSVIKIAHERFLTIAVGCGICLFMSFFVFPIWSSEDLHKITVSKLLGLSQSIEACVNEYFEEKKDEEEKDDDEASEDRIYDGYKAVLDSKSSDETLALYASWEPRHTWRCHKFPWQQYAKVGAVLRQFGYIVVALHGCLQTEIQTPRSVRALFKDPCIRLAGEVCKVLSELADSIRNRRHCSPEILSDQLHVVLQDLNSAIKSQPKLFLGSNLNHPQNAGVTHQQNKKNSLKHRNDIASNQNSPKQNGAVSISTVRTDTSALLEFRKSFFKRANTGNANAEITSEKKMLRPQLSKIAVMTSLEFSEALPFAAFASLLVEIVARLDNVIAEVEELGRIAGFKEYDPTVVVIQCVKPPSNQTNVVAPCNGSAGGE